MVAMAGFPVARLVAWLVAGAAVVVMSETAARPLQVSLVETPEGAAQRLQVSAEGRDAARYVARREIQV